MNEVSTMQATQKRPLPALTQVQRRLVEDNLNVVDRVARRYKVRCRSSVQHEDLVQLGALALTEAARRFDPAKGYAFPAMAAKRVKGAIQDHFRSLDPLSRGQRSQLRELESADREAGTRLGRAPSVPELAKRLGWESERVLEVRSLGEGLAQGWARTHECRDEGSVVDLLG